MLHSLLSTIDQFDACEEGFPEGSAEALSKEASALQERQAALEGAPQEDFALVLYDGHEHNRKFPVATAQDIEMSKEALDAHKDRLPDELVKTAKYYIDLAARKKLGEAAYEVEGEKMTNVVYTGHIDKQAFEKKRARAEAERLEKEADSAPSLLGEGRFPLDSEGHIKVAERYFATGLGTGPEKKAKAARRLIEQAKARGVELEKEAVTRYDRESIPPSLFDRLSYRKEAAPEETAPYYEELSKQAEAMGPMRTAKALHILDQISGFAPIETKTAGDSISEGLRKKAADTGAARRLPKTTPSAYEAVFPKEAAREDTSRLSEEAFEKVADVFGEGLAERYSEEGEKALEGFSSAERTLFNELL